MNGTGKVTEDGTSQKKNKKKRKNKPHGISYI